MEEYQPGLARILQSIGILGAVVVLLTFSYFLMIGSPKKEDSSGQKNSASATIDSAAREWARQLDAEPLVKAKTAEYNLNCLSYDYVVCAKLVVRAEKNQKLANALRYAASKNVSVIVREDNWAPLYGAGWVEVNVYYDDAAIIENLVGKQK